MTHGIAALGLELAAKSTLLLAGAFVVAGLARRWSSEERHALWAFAMLGLLALPAASVFEPRVGVPIGQLIASARTLAGAVEAKLEQGAPRPDEIVVTPDGAEQRGGRGEMPERAAADPRDRSSGAPHARPHGQEKGAHAWLLKAEESRIGTRIAIAAVAAYLSVALLLLAYFTAAALGVELSLRRLTPATDQTVLALFEHVRLQLGLRRRVRIKLSRSDSTPWAWGAWRPVVVLPESFLRLPAEPQRAAIVHELSHVTRFDFLSSLLGYLCCALYWFQPLAWLALKRMAQESERACDDRVLLAGGRPASYASQLLDVAQTIHGSRKRSVLASAMAGSSVVSRRIAAILDTDIRRKTMSGVKFLSALVLIAAIVLPLAALQAQESNTAVADPNDPDFLALVQRGPANSGELERIVDTYVEHGKQEAAADAIADYLLRDESHNDSASTDFTPPFVTRNCALCVTALRSTGSLQPIVLAAFGKVEQRANETHDGNLMIRLAQLCDRSGSRSAMDRGTLYILEGFQFGNLSSKSKLAAVGFISDRGWYAQAKGLAEQLRDDQSSGLYQSTLIKRVIASLDLQIKQSNAISQRLLSTTATSPEDSEIVPLIRIPPVYPPAALKQHKEGSVQLKFTIAKDGSTADVGVVSSTDSAFEDAAAKAVSQWRYAPRLVDGVPVAKEGVQTVIKFALTD
jgi:TonB family protein